MPMADDPNRDILPVKDDSYYGSVRCSSEIDPRERHMVCKLDRYQLEDRYLRLLEEVQGLKKLSNSQEDKIKRLATKLMRSAASSRACSAVLAVNDEREKITRLELENARLKDKAYTLKNQLLSHRGPRSPSRCRRVASGISSGPTTYRSESARTKYQPPPRQGVDENDAQNYLVKIEELETQRNGLLTRIAELESQISVQVAGIQREKVQENVEYIRMWRQMKQANDKLISVQATNDTLHSQIGDLKKLLEETTKNNREVTAALVSEKQRLSEIDDRITSAKDSELNLREKDEQIRDLTNEMKILQQHNNELISLSSKFGQIEMENAELKRKVSDYAQDNQSLKSALNSEQADHAALKGAKDKLMEKIEELQRNTDSLTMQLMTFQSRGESRFVSSGTQTEILTHVDKKIGTISSISSSCSTALEKVEESSIPSKNSHVDDRKLRFTNEEEAAASDNKNEINASGKIEAKKQSGNHSLQMSRQNSNATSDKSSKPSHHTSPSMSREKILMLLDQAQISTPLEAQNAARMRQIDVAVGQNDASKYPESYRVPITILQRSLKAGFASTDVPSTPDNEDDLNCENIEFFHPKQVLLMLFEILKGYIENVHQTIDSSCACGDLASCSTDDVAYSDLKNSILVERFGSGNETDQTLAFLYEKLKTGLGRPKLIEKRESNKELSNLLHKFTETPCCTCDSSHRCFATSDCGYDCCAPETDHGLMVVDKNDFSCSNNPATVKSGLKEIGSTIQKVFDSIYVGRDSYCGCTDECFDQRNEIKPLKPNGQPSIDKSSKVVSSELERCKELLRAHYSLNSGCKKEVRKDISNCETDCHTANECGDIPAFCEIAAFPLLITKGQGLVEIHILALQLSAKATQTLFKNNSHDISIFISWDVWGQETAFTPILKYPSLTFNSSSVYRVCELQNFFDSVLREQIVFQVHVIYPDEDTFTVAKAKLSVRDILDYPQNKLHYVTPVLSVMPCSCGSNFGQLSLWIRLSCDIDLVEKFKDRRGLVNAVSRNQQIHIPAQQRKDEPGSSPATKKGFSSTNPFPHNNLYSYPELPNASGREISEDVPDQHKNALGYLPKTKGNRLDTIRESAEPEYRRKSEEETAVKGKYRYEDPGEEFSDTNIERNDSLATSIATNENDSREDSDPGLDGTIEDTTSQDLRVLNLQKKLDTGEQIESGSITEFNNVLKNYGIPEQNNGSSLHGTGSTIDDLGTVISDEKWEKYKRTSERISISLPVKSEDSNVESIQGTFAKKDVPPSKDTITISIVTMNLFDKTSVMNNPDVNLLYIEYSFLGMRGADMETESLPKPKNKGESMSFNFTRKFQIDEDYHNSQRNMLIAMLSGTASPIIRFVIVSEPLPEEVDTKECIEVGHAELNIREYALGDGLKNVPLIIMNPEQSEQLGILKITIDGIAIIRNCMMVQKRL